MALLGRGGGGGGKKWICTRRKYLRWRKNRSGLKVQQRTLYFILHIKLLYNNAYKNVHKHLPNKTSRRPNLVLKIKLSPNKSSVMFCVTRILRIIRGEDHFFIWAGWIWTRGASSRTWESSSCPSTWTLPRSPSHPPSPPSTPWWS